MHELADAWQSARPELLGYLTRMVVRPDIAEELVQEAALRLLQAERRPSDPEGIRAWLFRVGTNLAIDHLRRHATWRETLLLETRECADRDAGFRAESSLLIGSPEVRAIAREHLDICFACALRNLPSAHAAALLLVEVYDFGVGDAAVMLGATPGQVKHWIQRSREVMRVRYAGTCALVGKQGVCHQCVELGGFFNRQAEDPLAGTERDVEARLAILRRRRSATLGPWHRMMMRLVDGILGKEA